jgi:N-methylhydantoinase A
VGRLAPLDVSRSPTTLGAAPAPRSREAYFRETGVVRCEVVARDVVTPGWTCRGPLIVESPDTTVVVPPGWCLRVEAGGLIALESGHA